MAHLKNHHQHIYQRYRLNIWVNTNTKYITSFILEKVFTYFCKHYN